VAGLGWQNHLEQLTDFLAAPDFEAADKWVSAHEGTNTYTFSKQAINAHVARAAYPLMAKGIRINAICPEPSLVREMKTTLSRWSGDLDQVQVPEGEREFGRRVDLPGQGQVMSPWLRLDAVSETEVSGTLRFGRYFLGKNGAVHGGALPSVLDDG
jgi:NAD(P)-dependent dehydrogenase (short-subunit alcohol dehydrogenase family)